MEYRVQNRLPGVTKNLLIINALMYLAQLALHPQMDDNLAMFPISSDRFMPFQVITHMFMHAVSSPTHIFFNMFALFMFGRDIEYALGTKRFLIFYLVTGLGAAFLHQLVGYIELQYVLDPNQANLAMNTRVLGASGAVYGLLAAFGMLYPNRMIMLLIPPIPIKAKYFVLIFGAIELYLGISGVNTGIAHFAHLGGAIFGIAMILIWKKRGKRL